MGLVACWAPAAGVSAATAAGAAESRPATAAPCGIVENAGQIAAPVLGTASCGAATLYFTHGAVVLDFPGETHAIRMEFEGARPSARIELLGQQGTRRHYFHGADPRRWRPDVRSFDEIVYRDLWPGIDLRFEPRAGQLLYEILPLPGVDPAAARLGFQGADRIVRDGERTTLTLPARDIVDVPLGDMPLGDGGMTRSLRWSAEDVGSVAREDPSTILWSTLVGGGDNEYSHALTLDAAGNPIVSGYTRSSNFPTTPGAYDRTHSGDYDVFVAKLDADGSRLIWATFLGGNQEDRCFGVFPDPQGNVYLAGLTYSPDFPTTPLAHDRTLGGARDAFAAKLNSSGSALWWSTYLGGTGQERVWDLELASNNELIVAGETFSSNFPTTPAAFDTTANGGADGFVTRFDPNGQSLVWSTYIGGSSNEEITFLAMMPGERLVGCGDSASPNYPTTPGAFDETHNGLQDCIVSIFDAATGALTASTFLGGPRPEWGNVVAVDGAGRPVVTGSTESDNFPTTPGCYDSTYNGDKDLFVCKLDAAAAGLVWSTYLGGGSTDDPFALAIDASDSPYLSGSVASFDYPTTLDGYDRTYGGNNDAFLTRLSADGDSLLWSSFLGGTLGEAGWELVIDPSSDPVLTGPTRSPDFPTTAGAYDQVHDGQNDVFLMRLRPAGLTAVDASQGTGRGILRAGPNPFHRNVEIGVDLVRPARVGLRVLDLRGRVVTPLLDRPLGGGAHTLTWNGRDTRGRGVPSGVYWLELRTGGTVERRKIIAIR
jgi:hypothetical protein